jgi:hypothetical protein
MLAQHKSCLDEICYLIYLSRQINKKQKASDLNVDCENKKRIKYDYKINYLILLDRGTLQRNTIPKRDGKVIRVYSNGTLKMRKGIYVQRVSISRCIPYVMTGSVGNRYTTVAIILVHSESIEVSRINY